MATRPSKPRRTSEEWQRDVDALALIKDSGVLNPDAKLDDILKLSERLGTQARADGHVFIFRNVVLVECPF